jgi:hypothetical protein
MDVFSAEYDGRRYIREWRIHLSRLSRPAQAG